jgi:hypothetical protein
MPLRRSKRYTAEQAPRMLANFSDIGEESSDLEGNEDPASDLEGFEDDFVANDDLEYSSSSESSSNEELSGEEPAVVVPSGNETREYLHFINPLFQECCKETAVNFISFLYRWAW